VSSMMEQYDELGERLSWALQPLAQVCGVCRGCCRSYAWAMAPEAPRMLLRGIPMLRLNGIAYVIDSFPRDKAGRRITDDVPLCRCIDSGRCQTYDVRPVHCRLYPLMLHPQPGGALLVWDPSCEFVAQTRRPVLERMAEAVRRMLQRLEGSLLSHIVGVYGAIHNICPGMDDQPFISTGKVISTPPRPR